MPTAVPTLTIVNSIATISGSEVGSTNVLVFTLQGKDDWHALDSIIGDGTIAIQNIAPGNYTGRAMSIGSPGTVSDAVGFTVSGGTLSGGVDPDWGRWCYASICQHFEANRGSLHMFLEGEHRQTQDHQQFFELRVDGPFYTQFQKGWWRLIVEVNAIVTVAKSDKDFHAIRRVTDAVASIFTNDIEVYKYGSGPLDDNTFIECLHAMDGFRRKLQISHFGQLQSSDDILMASIERHYKMVIAKE